MAKRKCPSCSRQIVGHPNKKFCGQKCKDRYHNAVNPRGFGAGREKTDWDLYSESIHPFSSEAFEQ